MVRNQLFKVLPRLLQHKKQDDSLLRPVTRLKQIVRLDNRLVRAVGKPLVHADRVKIPHRRPAHDPDTKRPIQGKVQGRIRLLHEPRLLIPVPDAKPNRNRSDQSLHAELACEAQHDNVEAHKSEIPPALAVVCWGIGVGAHVGGYEGIVACERVREEETGGQRIRRVRVDEVEGDDCEAEDEGEQPRVAYAHALCFGEVAACCSSFGATGGLFVLL
jgi:hypothetical protein